MWKNQILLLQEKEKIEDIGMKLDHLLSENITFYELLLEVLNKEKEEN